MEDDAQFDAFEKGLKSRYAKGTAAMNKKADKRTTRKALITVATKLAALDSININLSTLRSDMDSTSDPVEGFRESITLPCLQSVEVYTGTGVKLVDMLKPDVREQRLWNYMQRRFEQGAFPDGSFTILFHPYRCKDLWMMTNCSLPTKHFVPRIRIAGRRGNPPVKIISIDALVEDMRLTD